jgi:hypothetical protein
MKDMHDSHILCYCEAWNNFWWHDHDMHILTWMLSDSWLDNIAKGKHG